MARLYSRMNAGAIDDPHWGHFDPDPDNGGFDLPDDLSDQLAGFCHRGKPAWETETQRDERLHGEESARRRDPETLYNAVADIADITKQLAGLRAETAQNPDVTALTAQVKALTERLAAVEQPTAKTTVTKAGTGAK